MDTRSTIAVLLLIVVGPWAYLRTVASPNQTENPTASRIQAKITLIIDHAAKLSKAGTDVKPLYEAMQHVKRRLETGQITEAERILDTVMSNLGLSLPAGARSTGSPPQTENANSSRIKAKINLIRDRTTELSRSGADVEAVRDALQQVDRRLKAGQIKEAEHILDKTMAALGLSLSGEDAGRASTGVSEAADCDPQKPMTVSSRITVYEDCVIGGDLTVTGRGILYFDYRGAAGGRVVVSGNVIVQDDATLEVEGRQDARAVLVIDNEFSQHRSMTSRDRAVIKLNNVEFRTQKTVDRSRGSVSMTYEASGRSSLEVTGSTIVEAESWLLANLRDSATVTVVDTQHVPNEMYVHDTSVATIRGASTRTGVWLDAEGAVGTVTLPDVNGPFSWRIGAGHGLDVGWLLQVEDAQPGLGIEIRSRTALTINGHGAGAPATGELKISYFVVNAYETLDDLTAGVQDRTISDRLTLKDVQLGPIAWQIYAGDHADLTIRNSVINEIGIFGRNARVLVERSVLQLAMLAALAPDSLLTIDSSEIWNQAIEVANQAQVTIRHSLIHGSLFHARHADSWISIEGGEFRDNPDGCAQGVMVDIATGQPRCNPFSAPGRPRKSGAGKIACAETEGCGF